MAFDYDLVIIGGSAVARYAAAQASQLKARVALVEPDTTEHQLAIALCHHAALAKQGSPGWASSWANSWANNWDAQLSGEMQASSQNATTDATANARWQALLHHTRSIAIATVTNADVYYSLPYLAATGVDVILGEGTFCQTGRHQRRSLLQNLVHHQPRFIFDVNERVLRSRTYLLAPASQASTPPFENLTETNHRTIDSLWQHPWETLPSRLVILGGDPRGIELAQLFNALGVQVTIVVHSTQLLPHADPGVSMLLHAHLEAEGIDILTQTTITQIKQLGDYIWIQAGNHALEADALLVATGRHQPLAALNLDRAGVNWHPQRIPVNSKLQTTNPQIYACGDGLGGYLLPNLATHEADIALKNALFFPLHSVNYHHIPWSILTHPPVAQVGLTEAQARSYCSTDTEIAVVRQPFKVLVNAHLHNQTTGMCKVVLRSDGEILGAHGLGANANEWIGAIALAMKHHIKLQDIEASAFVSPSFSELISRLVQQWKQKRRSPQQRACLEGWFSWRRS